MAVAQLLAQRTRRGPARRERAVAGHRLDQDAQLRRTTADGERHLERRVIIDDIRRVRRRPTGPAFPGCPEQLAEDLDDARQIADQLVRHRGQRRELLPSQLGQRRRLITTCILSGRKRHLHHPKLLRLV